MSVWLCIPSARPAEEAQSCIDKWFAKGYKVALWRDPGAEYVECDFDVIKPYPGYAKAVNTLVRTVLSFDQSCNWVVTGGDDTDPDPTKRADEIADECIEHFGGSFGVMQPTGDRFAGGSIDRIAGSPWIGREFALRVNGGIGPYWPEYTHMFVDEEIMEVAQRMGVFWQRPDLTHLHHHFLRASEDINSGTAPRPTPPHLIEANSPEHWNKYKTLYLTRKMQGFPGALPA